MKWYTITNQNNLVSGAIIQRGAKSKYNVEKGAWKIRISQDTLTRWVNNGWACSETDYFKQPNTIDKIKNLVCSIEGYKVDVILNRCRKCELVEIRQIIHYIAKNNTSYTNAYIGQEVGSLGSATVISSCKTIQDRIDTEPGLKAKIESLVDKIIINPISKNSPQQKKTKNLEKQNEFLRFMIENKLSKDDLIKDITLSY